MKKILGGNKMKEPTREQIKEAFKKTIERWEKIVEDVDYFHESECALCLLESPDGEHYVCSQLCPIKSHTKGGLDSCHATPYPKFFQDKTPENALAELNFLRKVYIWWIEEEGKDVKGKEEWVDVSKEVKFWLRNDGVLQIDDKDRIIGHMWADGEFYWTCKGRDYKKEVFKDRQFRILKKT